MLWGSRFSKQFDSKALEFSSSLSYDINLIEWDIKVSKAHSNMLNKIGIITSEENQSIQNSLDTILLQFNEGNWIPSVSEFEDVHSAIESKLTELIGNTGKKLHTARSRNDQVITDVRLWIKFASIKLREQIIDLQKSLVEVAEDNINTVIPGYTHLQRAQPISFAFHLLAYLEMLERDKSRFGFSFDQADENVLGSGALAGSTIALDREFTTHELGFSNISKNALDSVSNRDFILDFLHSCNLSMLHLSRLSEEIILWTSYEWNFIKLGDEYTTGSSLMPQKKNPDLAELIRGKNGRTFGNYFALLSTIKSLPLSYNRDLQEDKEGMFDSYFTLFDSLSLMSEMIKSMNVTKDRFVQDIDGSFMLATDLADYLVLKGIPFRDAHDILGKIVKFATEENKKLNQITLHEFKNFSPLFEEDIYNSLSVVTCLQNKKTYGSPNPKFVSTAISDYKKILNM
ncbi:MAG: argininosuccinate lyase [Ignavibacteriales bacterium]|nr:argininosuccinate lyase [Ignavibacteriales bacterium]